MVEGLGRHLDGGRGGVGRLREKGERAHVSDGRPPRSYTYTYTYIHTYIYIYIYIYIRYIYTYIYIANLDGDAGEGEDVRNEAAQIGVARPVPPCGHPGTHLF